MPHSICTLLHAKCATSCGVVGPMHQCQSVCALCYWHTQTLLHYSLHCTRTAQQHKDPPTSTSPFGTSPTRGGNLLVTGNTHCGQGTKAKTTKGATRREGREERSGGEALAAACKEKARMAPCYMRGWCPHTWWGHMHAGQALRVRMGSRSARS